MFIRTILRALPVALVAVIWMNAAESPGGGVIEWKEESVRADVSDWPLDRVLMKLGSINGWSILMEPGLSQSVTVRFANRPPADAIALLVHPANFSIRLTPAGATELLVFHTDASKATQQVSHSREQVMPRLGGVLANELIVTLKTNVSPEAVAGKVSATIRGRIDPARAYRLEFSDAESAAAARAMLESDPNVESVNANHSIPRPAQTLPSSTGSTLPFSLSPDLGNSGGQLIVALVDAAVQPMGGAFDSFLLPGVSIEQGYTPGSGSPTHGTSMAETLLRGLDIASGGGTSSVRLLPVDVYGSRETTSTFDLAWGISKAVESGATLVNLSLGSDSPSALIETLIQNSVANGVTFLSAAGNSPTTAATYPAAYPEVTAVTAGSPGGQVATFANRGDFVDAVGPAGSIVQYGGAQWYVTGTSPATAFLTGVTAGLASSTKTSPATAVQTVVRKFPFNP